MKLALPFRLSFASTVALIAAAAAVVHLKEPARKLAWCRARLPVPGGFLHVERQEGKRNLSPPAGYRVVRH